jgi:hypothetical protein
MLIDTQKSRENSINFILIIIYLHENLTAQRTITKLAGVHRKKQQTYKKYKIRQFHFLSAYQQQMAYNRFSLKIYIT